MLKIIRNLLAKIIDDIDAGNSNITEDEAIKLIGTLKELTDKEKRLSKYAACRYLNISRATFDNYVREGKLPRGKHEIGFKELSWSRKDLDYFIKKNKENQSLLNNIYNEVENGRKYVGEKFDMTKAKEVCERYRGILSQSITHADVYVAINSHYHDYCELFKAWFGDGIDQKIIESAIIFWFKDDDHREGSKLWNYFKEN